MLDSVDTVLFLDVLELLSGMRQDNNSGCNFGSKFVKFFVSFFNLFVQGLILNF